VQDSAAGLPHRILHALCIGFCSALEVVVRNLQVVLRRNQRAVADPSTNNMNGKLGCQLGLPAGPQIVEELWPRFQTGATDDTKHARPEILGRIAVAADDVYRSWFGEFKGRLEVWA
jgi:hypothetical protein